MKWVVCLGTLESRPSKWALLFDKCFARIENLDSLVWEHIFLKKRVQVPQLGTFFKEQNIRKENEIFNCFKWNLQHYLFIHSFIDTGRHVLRLPLPRTDVAGSQACSLLPSKCILKCWFLSDFEQLCGTWIVVAKFIVGVWRSEVTTRRLLTNSWNIKYLLLQRDVSDGCSWPIWVHVGAWAPPLWYMFEWSHSKQSWPFLMVFG
jgi:hypothetical protein